MGASLSSSAAGTNNNRSSSSSSSSSTTPGTVARSTSFLSFLSRGQPFQPEGKDAVRVVDELARTGLPRELAIDIVDLAEYWPLQVSQTQVHVIVRASTAAQSVTSLLISSAIPAAPSQNPVRKVTITTESRDQGFSSFPQHHGTRQGSSSWFEIALIRPVSTTAHDESASSASLSGDSDGEPGNEPEPFVPSNITARSSAPPHFIVARQLLYYNIHASRDFMTHSQALERGSPIVDQAREGDRFVVYVCAQYPAWANECRMCRVATNYSAI